MKDLAWEIAYKKYKKIYPDLDKTSFIHGYVACINAIYADATQNQSK